MTRKLNFKYSTRSPCTAFKNGAKKRFDFRFSIYFQLFNKYNNKKFICKNRDITFQISTKYIYNGDFLAREELDDLYFLLDGGFLDDDAKFNVEIDAVVSEVADDPSDST